MKEPAQALEHARRAAAAKRTGTEAAQWNLGDEFVSTRRLAEWALIEPEPEIVVSTRRLGRPITAFKRLLVRLLGQYLGQITAQQSRFNAHIAAHVMRLEERVAALEDAARERDEQS
jgi:hypothetical protein